MQVIKFCVTGDQLPVDVSDIDLHILRCLLHYMCTSIKTIYIFSLKETIGVLQRHISSLTDRIARFVLLFLYPIKTFCTE